MTAADEAFDAIILGAGAAGLMCALTAGQRGRKVLLLEHTDKAGAKILISGGGRCNFTNLASAPDRFQSGNPHFCTSALRRYTQSDFIELVRRHGIAFHEKTLGQLFCDGSARAIVAMLLAECASGGVDLRLGQKVTSVSRTEHFRVETNRGASPRAALVLATGGLSIPKMGATGFSYDLARRFGLRVTQTLPGLVPLKAAPDAPGFDAGSGGRVLGGGCDVREAELPRKYPVHPPRTFRAGHPADLVLLAPRRRDHPRSAAGPRRGRLPRRSQRARPKAAPQTVLAEVMPARLAQALTAAHLPPGRDGQISDRTLVSFAERLKHWQFLPDGRKGYAKAEVTLGGIERAICRRRRWPRPRSTGLYVIGEAVDVTGWLGGYNFQWAWSSGWSAGQAI